MAAYIISLLLTLIFLRISIKYKKWYYHLLTILPSVILLTYRGVDVGTDTIHYTDLYSSAESSYSYISFLLGYRLEYGFGSLLYLTAHTGFPVQFGFFVMALFTIVPVYTATYLLKDKVSPYMMLTLYFLMFYQYSFNIVRQSIAMSFILLTVALLFTNHKRLAIIFAVTSILFHNTAILILPLLTLYLLKGKNRIKLLALLTVIVGVIYFYGKDYIDSSMDYYSDAYLSGSKVSAQSSYLVEMGLNLFLVLIAWKKYRTSETNFCLMCSFFVFVLILMSTVFSYAFRIANCYDILALIAIPLAIKTLKSPIIRSGYECFAVFYWWFVFIYNNSGGTYPFQFI